MWEDAVRAAGFQDATFLEPFLRLRQAYFNPRIRLGGPYSTYRLFRAWRDEQKKAALERHPVALLFGLTVQLFANDGGWQVNSRDSLEGLQTLGGNRLAVIKRPQGGESIDESWIVLAPPGVENGDIVCGLNCNRDSAYRPVILRPSKSSNEIGTTRCYTIVGLCYADGHLSIGSSSRERRMSPETFHIQ